MNPTKTSFITAAGVTIAALAVVYGSNVRESVELGRSLNRAALTTETTPMGLEASNKQIPEDDFFRGLVRLLKREYVEPITDERKLAVGAVKGMVESLRDPRSTFMDANEFRAYTNATGGKYEGIGVDLAFDRGHRTTGGDQMSPADMEALSIPRLKVVAVTPGGPADHAGVKPGDWVDTVEGHWVLNPDPVEQYRKAIQSVSPKATKNLPPAELKARQQKLRVVGAALKGKLDTMIMPARAKDMLTIGNKGSLSILWHRGDKTRPTTIVRKESVVPVVQTSGDTITLRFAYGAAEKLKHAIGGKSAVTLDLRNNSNGDFESMEQCLAVLAPAGTYGYLHSQKPGKSRKFATTTGNSKPPRLTILVDPTTRGAADIFATALASRHLAKLSGTASEDRSVVEVVGLPDGSGYTLVTGEYMAKEPAPSKRIAILSDKPATPVAARETDGTIVSALKMGGNA